MLTIAAENPRRSDVQALIEAGDAYATSLYPAESNHMLDVAALCAPEVSFFVARLDGRAIGCAALVRRSEGWAEIKRMYVSPAARGRGVGRRLLEALEEHSEGLTLRLETGVRQSEAVALYRSFGFTEIGPFGGYAPDPLSIFMEKAGSGAA